MAATETQSAYEYRARDTTDTERLAAALAFGFGPGTVVALDGDLGAGKTTFSQSVARHLGVRDVVNSPTFTIIKEYEGAELPFYHMDVYRINGPEAEELGLDEYFFGRGVTLVEWASRLEELLPEERLDIYIENNGGTQRTFRLTPHGSAYEELCRRLKGNGLLG